MDYGHEQVDPEALRYVAPFTPGTRVIAPDNDIGTVIARHEVCGALIIKWDGAAFCPVHADRGCPMPAEAAMASLLEVYHGWYFQLELWDKNGVPFKLVPWESKKPPGTVYQYMEKRPEQSGPRYAPWDNLYQAAVDPFIRRTFHFVPRSPNDPWSRTLVYREK